MNAPGAPRISVVICSYGGEHLLPRALEAVRAQTLAADEYEVIVVDDASPDRTAAVAVEAGVRVLRLERNGGLSAARNAGWRHARAPIVAFTDDDCDPHPTWLEELLKGFDDAGVDGVSGSVVPTTEAPLLLRYLRALNPLQPLSAQLLESRSRLYRLKLYLKDTLTLGGEPTSPLYAVVGANMAFRAAFLRSVTGFDPAFRFGSDEEELCLRSHERAAGARFAYRPSAVVEHRFDPSLRDSVRRARSYGVGHARMAAKHSATGPIVYPFPLAFGLALAAALGLRRPATLAAAGVLPMLCYLGWPVESVRARDPSYLAFPYLQMVLETATMAGQVKGARAGYVPVPDDPRAIEVTA